MNWLTGGNYFQTDGLLVCSLRSCSIAFFFSIFRAHSKRWGSRFKLHVFHMFHWWCSTRINKREKKSNGWNCWMHLLKHHIVLIIIAFQQRFFLHFSNRFLFMYSFLFADYIYSITTSFFIKNQFNSFARFFSFSGERFNRLIV